MRDDLRQLAWFHAIIKCEVGVVRHLNCLVARDQGGDGDKAAVPWRKARAFP